MKQNIHTQWHKFVEDMERGDKGLGLPSLPETKNLKLASFRELLDMHGVVKAASVAPLYFISPELVPMLQGPAVNKSMLALIDANKLKLPYPAMMLEFDTEADEEDLKGNKSAVALRLFVLISERAEGHWTAFVFRRAVGKDGNLAMLPLQMFTVIPQAMESEEGRKAGVEVRCSAVFWTSDNHVDLNIAVNAAARVDAEDISLAVTASMLLLHTRGVEGERVEPTKLNKARIKSGKTTIPAHTVLHIGTVTTRDGVKRKYDPTDKFMTPHWRRGHYRKQKYGPGWTLERDIYIEPMIVNYKEDEPAPTPKVLKW